jgi:hypothetical protein
MSDTAQKAKASAEAIRLFFEKSISHLPASSNADTSITKQSMCTVFSERMERYILSIPEAVCNFGRMHVGLEGIMILLLNGPGIEAINSFMKNQMMIGEVQQHVDPLINDIRGNRLVDNNRCVETSFEHQQLLKRYAAEIKDHNAEKTTTTVKATTFVNGKRGRENQYQAKMVKRAMSVLLITPRFTPRPNRHTNRHHA